jgi:hypothetical protein
MTILCLVVLPFLGLLVYALAESPRAKNAERAADDLCDWCETEPGLWNVRDRRDRAKIRVCSPCLANGRVRGWWVA